MEIENNPKSLSGKLPREQYWLLIFILLGYPILSLILNALGAQDTETVVSKISEIYLPAMFIQLIMILAIYMVLKIGRSGLEEIGLGQNDMNLSNLISGVIFFVGAFSVMVIVKGAVTRSGFLPDKDFQEILPSNIYEKICWVFLSIGAAVSEELCFRGFVISKLRQIFGNNWSGILLGSMAFSMGHLYQGVAGMLIIFIYGILFSLLFISRGSIFPGIVAHFIQDILAIFII